MKEIKIFIFFFLSGVSFVTKAHPVIYRDGFELKGESQERESKYTALYSFTERWSVGGDYYQLRKPDLSPTKTQVEAFGMQVNHLLKRWNQDAAQGNIYVGLSAGSFAPEGQSSQFQWGGDVSADWESTRYYVEAKYSSLRPEHTSSLDFKTLRLGFAPYVLDGEGFHTWFIVQTTQMNRERRQITPLFRFFYQNVLLELGHSLDGEWLFQFMIHN